MAGIVLLLAAGAVGVFTATVLKPRVPPPVAMALLAVVGGCLGAGALLVQDEPVNAVNWAAPLLEAEAMTPTSVTVP